jgi:FG-GAP repeat protein
VPAQGAISAVLGRDQPAYHATPSRAGLAVRNHQHGLSVDFGPAGLEIISGTARLGMRLEAVGYGERLTPVAATIPKAQANRIEYRRGRLTEWYANGPVGVQQGFTLQAPPAEVKAGPLTLALALSGNLKPALDKATNTLTLAASGQAVLRYRGLSALDATGRELPASLKLTGQTLTLEVDDRDARYPLLIDPFIEAAKLTASDGATDDFFGFSVAVDGDTVVVGAKEDDLGANTDQGSAYVFVKPAGGWANATETAKLTASDGAANDQFGVSVAISGDTVIVGSWFDDNAGLGGPGSAYVFVRPPGGWLGALNETAKLSASDSQAGDSFGISVAVSGETVVVGANLDDFGDTFSAQGSAYVFVRPAGGWAGALNEDAKLSASDKAETDRFGNSVAISGDTVVVGASLDNLGTNTDQGSAYVFVKPTGGWAGALNEDAKLTASDGAGGDNFGYSVAVSGDTVAAGAILDTVDGAGKGSAYVFVKPATGWASTSSFDAKLTASDGATGDFFGASVAIIGDTVVAGARFGPGANHADQGAAYVFDQARDRVDEHLDLRR